MTAGRFFAIILVFVAATAGWMMLGGSVWHRTQTLDARLSKEMRSLWGPAVLTQGSPFWSPQASTARQVAGVVDPTATRVIATIAHEHRNKGLLWYSTFTVGFEADYTIPADGSGASTPGFFVFELPPGATGYDGLALTVNDVPQTLTASQITAGGLLVPLDRSAPARVHVRYTTYGRDVWAYAPGDGLKDPSGGSQTTLAWDAPGYELTGAGRPLVRLSDFSLTIQTNFADIDYPKGARSPSKPAQATKGGMAATWTLQDALTNQPMGIAMPAKPNAGPIVARMSFFAPVSLLFFFTVVFTVVVLKKIPLHPMHYLFVAAGFFAFHILLAYLADKVPVQTSFWISAAVSVLLVVSYVRLVAGIRFAVCHIGLAQLVYLLGFSYAFFFPGWTGLTVVIGAVATLFVLMQATGRVDWFAVFARATPLPPPLPPRDR